MSIKALIHFPGQLKRDALSFWNVFLSNKITIQRFIKNSFWLTASLGMNGIVNLCLAIYLARFFGPTNYGKFAYALSFVGLFATLFDFGLTMAVTRELAKNHGEEKNLPTLFFLKFLIGILTVMIIIGLSFLVSKDFEIRKMIIAFGVYQLFFQALNLIYAVFRAKQRMEFEGFGRLLQAGILVIFASLLIWRGASVLSITYAYAVTTLLTFFVLILVMWRTARFSFFHYKIDLSVAKKFLVIGLYLALAQGVGDVMTNTDSFLLGYWGMLRGVGLYYAAVKINAVILFAMSIVTTAIFPMLVNALSQSQKAFMQYWNVWMKITLFFAMFATFVMLAKAEGVIMLFYKNEYVQAATVLRILMLTAIVIYINNFYFQVLVITNHQRLVFYSTAFGCIVNVVINILFIPHFGIVGSAVATVCSQGVNGLLYMIFIKNRTFLNPLNYAFVSMIVLTTGAGLLMWFSLSFIHLKLFLDILIGAFIYASTFFALRGILKTFRFNEDNYANY
ncbi:MAG: flippase [Gammaproteobacteria bacterium]|nr:flippase [Gammaproteobacteria bacterium]